MSASASASLSSVHQGSANTWPIQDTFSLDFVRARIYGGLTPNPASGAYGELPGLTTAHTRLVLQTATVKTRRWECDRPGVEPTSSGLHVWGQYHSSEKVTAVMSGTGIHRLIYREICVERGASYAAWLLTTATYRRQKRTQTYRKHRRHEIASCTQSRVGLDPRRQPRVNPQSTNARSRLRVLVLCLGIASHHAGMLGFTRYIYIYIYI